MKWIFIMSLLSYSMISAAGKLNHFEWSHSSNKAGETGVTYTFNYEIETANPYFVFYALSNSNGIDTNAIGNPIDTSKVSVLIDGRPVQIDNNGTNSYNYGSGLFLRLKNPEIAESGSKVAVTLTDVRNKPLVGTFSWKWIRTSNSAGWAIDEPDTIAPLEFKQENTIPVPDSPITTSCEIHNLWKNEYGDQWTDGIHNFGPYISPDHADEYDRKLFEASANYCNSLNFDFATYDSNRLHHPEHESAECCKITKGSETINPEIISFLKRAGDSKDLWERTNEAEKSSEVSAIAKDFGFTFSKKEYDYLEENSLPEDSTPLENTDSCGGENQPPCFTCQSELTQRAFNDHGPATRRRCLKHFAECGEGQDYLHGQCSYRDNYYYPEMVVKNHQYTKFPHPAIYNKVPGSRFKILLGSEDGNFLYDKEGIIKNRSSKMIIKSKKLEVFRRFGGNAWGEKDERLTFSMEFDGPKILATANPNKEGKLQYGEEEIKTLLSILKAIKDAEEFYKSIRYFEDAPKLQLNIETDMKSKNGSFAYKYGQDSGSMSFDITKLAVTKKHSESSIRHEYGHKVMHELVGMKEYLEGSICSTQHGPTMKTDMNCAFEEGWANFYAAISVDIDEYSLPSPGSNYNIETYPGPRRNLGYDHSIFEHNMMDEGRVSAALYDLWDSGNEENSQNGRDGKYGFTDKNIGIKTKDMFRGLEKLGEMQNDIEKRKNCENIKTIGNKTTRSCYNMRDYFRALVSLGLIDNKSINSAVYNYVFTEEEANAFRK